MVKYYIYNTGNNRVLEFRLNGGGIQVVHAPFNGTPNQQWEFTPSRELGQLGQCTIQTVVNTPYKWLQPIGSPQPPKDGYFVWSFQDPVLWKFLSLTVVPVDGSVFKLAIGNLYLTTQGEDAPTQGVDGIWMKPDAGQIVKGSQVWQLRAV